MFGGGCGKSNQARCLDGPSQRGCIPASPHTNYPLPASPLLLKCGPEKHELIHLHPLLSAVMYR